MNVEILCNPTILEFKSMGISDSFGMTLTNVSLIKDEVNCPIIEDAIATTNNTITIKKEKNDIIKNGQL